MCGKFLLVWLLFSVNIVLVELFGLETALAILGLLPTTHLLAGGAGLIGLKLALLSRLLVHMGVIGGNQSAISDSARAAIEEVTSSNSTSSFGLRNFLVRYFGTGSTAAIGYVNSTELNETHDAMHETIQRGQTYFPLPGLRISYDNNTRRYALVRNEDFYPSVMLPPNYADFNGYDNANQLPSYIPQSNSSFLYYPLQPTKVAVNNVLEPGYISISNQTELVSITNGTVLSIGNVTEYEFDGFAPEES
ncbi:hypothetical protein HDE_03165 [Halotydeus destructor]|nr:hypothetical protein HDE_03165 [Halotydeus destructor]